MTTDINYSINKEAYTEGKYHCDCCTFENNIKSVVIELWSGFLHNNKESSLNYLGEGAKVNISINNGSIFLILQMLLFLVEKPTHKTCLTLASFDTKPQIAERKKCALIEARIFIQPNLCQSNAQFQKLLQPLLIQKVPVSTLISKKICRL